MRRSGLVYEAADEVKRRLLALETQAVLEILRAYRAFERFLLARLADVAAGLESAPSSENWRYAAIERYEEQLFLVRAAAEAFAAVAEERTASLQRSAVELAAEMAEEIAGRIGVVWSRPPDEALANLVGTLGDGSPLRRLFDQFGEAASRAGRDAIEASVAGGENPREAARRLAAALEGASPEGVAAELTGRTGKLRDRALLIARTETLRSHRSAALENYRANADILEGWEWHSARDSRTCPICWAMDGTVHPIDEPFGTHVQCRCAAVPVFDGIERRGTGEEAFERLPSEKQVEILGEAHYELYESGVPLSAMVRLVHSHDWGPERRLRSAKSLREGLTHDGGGR